MEEKIEVIERRVLVQTPNGPKPAVQRTAVQGNKTWPLPPLFPKQ